jgi:hypothetical protein
VYHGGITIIGMRREEGEGDGMERERRERKGKEE